VNLNVHAGLCAAKDQFAHFSVLTPCRRLALIWRKACGTTLLQLSL
jgi:hypothetical protein